MNKFNDIEFLKNAKKISDIGLFHGKMGICIFAYFYGKKTQNAKFTQMADALIDEIYELVSKSSPTNFDSGLAGIGWGISFLAQNDFVEIDLNDALEEIDMAILKILTSEIPLGLNIANGLTGYLLYLTQRISDTKQTVKSYSMELNKELIILTINKIEECFQKAPPMLSKDIRFDLFGDIPLLIFCLGRTYELHIYNNKINQIVNQLIPFIETNLSSLNTNRLILACELLYLIKYIHDDRIDKLADFLLYTVNFNLLTYEIGSLTHGIRYGLTGLKIILERILKVLTIDSIYYNKTWQILTNFPEINEEFENTDSQIHPFKIGLTEGATGIILAKTINIKQYDKI